MVNRSKPYGSDGAAVTGMLIPLLASRSLAHNRKEVWQTGTAQDIYKFTSEEIPDLLPQSACIVMPCFSLEHFA